MGALRQAAVRGTFWSALSTVFSRGLRFCVTIVLARLLVPSDFGLFAMGMLVIDIAEMLSDLGFGAALIQRAHLEPEHLSTCFWMNQAIGVVLWAVTVVISPLAAAFYRNPHVQPVLTVMALTFLLAPIGSIPWVLLNRELRFKELMIAQSVATIVRAGVALSLAWRGAGVWSLVWGPLAGTVAGAVVNWSYCRWRPTFTWSWRHFLELFRFGRSIFGTRIVGYFVENSDNLITGRVLGASMLGVYNFAYQIPHLAETHMATIVNRVLFPVLSQVQHERERLRRGYLQSVRWIALFSVPFTVGLCLVAPEFVPTVYGTKWMPVVVPLQILCAAGLVHSLTSIVWIVIQALGRPDIGFWWNIATLPFVVGSLIVSARWGVNGIAITMTVLSVTLSLAIQHIMNRLAGLSWRRWAEAIQTPVIAAGGMAAVVVGARSLCHASGWPTWQTLIASIVTGTVTYGAVVIWRDHKTLAELRELLQLRPVPPSLTRVVGEVRLKVVL